MLVSAKRPTSRRRTALDYFNGDKALLACWPLLPEYGLMDIVGGNHLVTANATPYGPEKITSEGAYFNGSSNSIKTTAALNISSTNKITVLSDIKWNSYNLASDLIIYEHGANSSANAGTFRIDQSGSVIGDPITTHVRGNVGNANALYYVALTQFQNGRWANLGAVFDMSLATMEPSLNVDGYLLEPTVRTANSNNAQNFTAQTLYIAARAGASLFSNISMKNLAIITRTDIDHADYNAFMRDQRNPHLFSFFSQTTDYYQRLLRRSMN